MKTREKRSFTLIELLIVVAIIGILAAIAVPNFLNARTKASIARVKADFRTITTAMQSYFMDNNDYPPDTVGPNVEDQSYKYLTTPIAYLSNTELCRDHFTAKGGRMEGGQTGIRNFYDYGHVPYIREAGVGFVIVSFGPDRVLNMPWSTPTMNALKANDGSRSFFLYESSNGLVSSGDIIGTVLGIHNR